MELDSTRVTRSVDGLTVAMVGVLAYAIANLSHEVLGHCGVAAVLGVPCRVISTTNIPLVTQPPTWIYNIIVVAGVTGNFAVALLCWFLRKNIRTNHTAAYFLWLTMSVNLFLATSYIGVAPIIKFGDSYILISRLSHQWFWRSVVAAFGALALWFSFRLSVRELSKTVGGQTQNARTFAWKLVLPPYLAGSTVIVASALFSELDQKVAQLQAVGGTFVLTAWLLLLPLVVHRYQSHTASSLSIDRSVGWILLGFITAVIVVGVMGRGITLQV